LKILFIGYNPGILSAGVGHHYAHKSNRFWKLLYESGLTPYKFEAIDDTKLTELGLGSTNIVDRPSKTASEITTKELKEGAEKLYKLIKEIKPKIACYTGIGVYRAYASTILSISPIKLDIHTGIQQDRILEDTIDFVCSNPSGLNTIPYAEQLKCFTELKKLKGGEIMNNEINITTYDRLLRAWENSMELVRDYETYSKRIDEKDQEAIQVFKEFAEDEGIHAAKLHGILLNYNK